MRILKLAIGVVALAALTFVPAFAGQHGNSGNHGPVTHVVPDHPGPPPNAGPKTTSGPTTQGGGSSAHGPHTPDSDGASAHNTGAHSPKKGNTSTTTTTSTGPVDFAATPVGQKLTRNTALQSKLAGELQALGYQGTVFQGAFGFKNLGQFVAAVNVANNLGIPFEQLKSQMTGVTVDAAGHVLQSNTPTKSLGQAIQTLKPGANADKAAESATEEAETEVEKGTSTTTTTTTTATTKANKKKSS